MKRVVKWTLLSKALPSMRPTSSRAALVVVNDARKTVGKLRRGRGRRFLLHGRFQVDFRTQRHTLRTCPTAGVFFPHSLRRHNDGDS